MLIGVTGPLVLDTRGRDVVARAVENLLADTRWPAHCGRYSIVSGMAAGADLVLAEVLAQTLRRTGAEVGLGAWLPKPLPELKRDWLDRARQLGDPPSEPAQAAVDGLRDRLLASATVEYLDRRPGEDAYRLLAARLAMEPALLVAVNHAGRRGAPGGSAEVVAWRRQPETIPVSLSARFAANKSEALALIDAATGHYRLENFNDLAIEADLPRRIRARLSAGNALAANDLAARAMAGGNVDPQVRYLYLLSLAGAGNPRRALDRYDELAPAPEQRDEDWLALHARLLKDLAFAGIAAADNLRAAEDAYAAAFRRTGGSFSAVNAASLALLGGRDAEARTQAAAAIAAIIRGGDERARYFAQVTRAEAEAVRGDVSAMTLALRKADPLLRDDLTTRCRTRGQIARVLRANGLERDGLAALAMPDAYLLDAAGVAEWPETLTDALRMRLGGSPLFATEPPDAGGLLGLERLLAAGMRLHLVLRDQREAVIAGWRRRAGLHDSSRLRALIDGAEQVVNVAGFLPTEDSWRDRYAARLAQGLAALSGLRLHIPLRRLGVIAGAPPRWEISPIAAAPRVRASRQRRMVGLVFSDMAHFSVLSDPEVRVFWTELMPRIATVMARHRASVLLQQTWGDALHIVTADARSAAELSLDLTETVRALREGYSGHLGALEIRIGAHFAPAYVGLDPVQNVPTYYGTQLSFTARMEPVTPPGSVFVTEQFSAELTLEAADDYRFEYAGEVALAKHFGTFRLYSLARAAQGQW